MDKKPNLIYVFADQLRYNALGYNGDEYAYTKNIDAFSEECMRCDNVFSGHPVCAPYRASLFTGKYTTSTGMVINEIRINPYHDTIAKVLTRNGYETCYLGKWHLYAAQLGHHFDVKNSYIPRGEDRLGFDDYFAGYNFHHKYYAPYAYYHEDSAEKIYVEGFEPDRQIDMAIEHIDRLDSNDKPFAMFLSIGTPHDPWTKENVPEKYYLHFKDVKFKVPENYKKFNDIHADGWARIHGNRLKKINEWKKAYYAMVMNLDENIKRLTDHLKEKRIFENTIFVFTSDHGEMFGAQGRHAKNIFYNEAVHVPFLIKWDGHLKCDNNDTVINTVDLMPTLLTMMGLEVPEGVEGRDKSKCLMDGEQEDEYDGALLMGTGATAIWGNGFEWRGYRTKRYTYATYRIDKSEYLFDDIADPYQKTNLVKDPKYKDVLSKMKEKMYGEMARVGDNFDKTSYYKKYWVKDRIIQKDLIRSK